MTIDEVNARPYLADYQFQQLPGYVRDHIEQHAAIGGNWEKDGVYDRWRNKLVAMPELLSYSNRLPTQIVLRKDPQERPQSLNAAAQQLATMKQNQWALMNEEWWRKTTAEHGSVATKHVNEAAAPKPWKYITSIGPAWKPDASRCVLCGSTMLEWSDWFSGAVQLAKCLSCGEAQVITAGAGLSHPELFDRGLVEDGYIEHGDELREEQTNAAARRAWKRMRTQAARDDELHGAVQAMQKCLPQWGF